MAEALSGFSIPVLNSAISQRVIFAEAAASGQVVHEIDPRGPASREIDQVMDEILTGGKR